MLPIEPLSHSAFPLRLSIKLHLIQNPDVIKRPHEPRYFAVDVLRCRAFGSNGLRHEHLGKASDRNVIGGLAAAKRTVRETIDDRGIDEAPVVLVSRRAHAGA